MRGQPIGKANQELGRVRGLVVVMAKGLSVSWGRLDLALNRTCVYDKFVDLGQAIENFPVLSCPVLVWSK